MIKKIVSTLDTMCDGLVAVILIGGTGVILFVLGSLWKFSLPVFFVLFMIGRIFQTYYYYKKK